MTSRILLAAALCRASVSPEPLLTCWAAGWAGSELPPLKAPVRALPTTWPTAEPTATPAAVVAICAIRPGWPDGAGAGAAAEGGGCAGGCAAEGAAGRLRDAGRGGVIPGRTPGRATTVLDARRQPPPRPRQDGAAVTKVTPPRPCGAALPPRPPPAPVPAPTWLAARPRCGSPGAWRRRRRGGAGRAESETATAALAVAQGRRRRRRSPPAGRGRGGTAETRPRREARGPVTRHPRGSLASPSAAPGVGEPAPSGPPARAVCALENRSRCGSTRRARARATGRTFKGRGGARQAEPRAVWRSAEPCSPLPRGPRVAGGLGRVQSTHPRPAPRKPPRTLTEHPPGGIRFPPRLSSVAQSCPTLCDPMDCSTPSFPVHHQLPEFTQTHLLSQ